MADFEDEGSANPATVNGLHDDISAFDDSTLGRDLSHFSKISEPHAQPSDPFTPHPSAVMANSEYTTAHEYGDYRDEEDYRPANEIDRGFESLQDDLPANFAKEASRGQYVPESDNFDDETNPGRGDEADDTSQQGNFSNPFGADLMQGSGVTSGSYVDNSDRPIMGYNPFLNEEGRQEQVDEEGDEHHLRGSQEGIDHSRGFGGCGDEEDDDEREATHERRWQEDSGEDDADLQRESANNIQSESDEMMGRDDEGPVDYEKEDLKYGVQPVSGDYSAREYDDEMGDHHTDERDDDDQGYPKEQTNRSELEQLGIYDDESREDDENVVPQTRHVEEDDLGIVNQGFSDDADMEGSKIISEEEEIVESENKVNEASNRRDFEDEVEEREKYDDERDEDEKATEEQYDGKEMEVEETEQSYLQKQPAYEMGEFEQESKGDYADEDDERESLTQNYTGEQPRHNEMEHVATKGDYIQDHLCPDEDEARVEMTQEKDYSSRFPDSDAVSSEYEERSFVDNMSEVTSPETIPQPLPSPPEPQITSPFDPQVPHESTSPCHEPDENLGQHGAAQDENNTADFLTVGEVVGETKFGVDGTAITSTTQNNQFLHSDEEYEEEEDEESQNLDQGQTATGTTETETSVDERSGEFGGQVFEQMEGKDNALMSMSMEGSFYDDGGELIGGEDRRNQQENHLYEGGSITEESSQHDSIEHKHDSYSDNRDDFGQHDFAQDKDHQPLDDDFGFRNEQDLDQRGFNTGLMDSSVNGLCEDSKAGRFDSLLDSSVTDQGLQAPFTEHEEVGESSVDIMGIDSTANESESSVDSQQLQPHDVQSMKDVDSLLRGDHILDVAPEKPEEPAASVDEVAAKEESTGTAPEAAAATAAGVAVAGAAAAAAATKAATTAKKPAAKPAGKTTTTTATKVTKETKISDGKAATTKKSETTTTTTTTKMAPKKPTESRPTSAATTTAERKTSAKSTTSPTKPSTAAPTSRTPGSVPSYAQPVTPRKPREATTTTTSEEKKKPASATTTPRTTSASRTTRPQSATTATSSSTTTTKTTTKTTVTTATTAASRTAQTARPKSSPTKLTNGTAAAPSDTKSPTKKYGIDSKPGGTPKTPAEKKEVKATPKADAGAKGAAPSSPAAKSPTKTATPRTTTTPKSAEVKSKIGSLNNAAHTPGGGHVKITSKKPDFTNVTSKIGSKDKMDHKPGGGNVKIESKKIKVEAKSKIGSLDNASHKPGGGDKKIESQKIDWKAESKVGSLDNAQHKAGGGDKKIESQKLDWKVESKIGSLENAQHKPGGGDKKIEVQKTEWKAQSKIGSLDNVKHKPGGGDSQQTESPKTSKVGSIEKPGPGSGSEQGVAEVHNGAASEN